MGAFDGFWIPHHGVIPKYVTPPVNHNKYIPGQPAFNLTRQFTLQDFAKLVRGAESAGKDCVYLPPENKGYSGARVDLWYAKALLEHLTAEGGNGDARTSA